MKYIVRKPIPGAKVGDILEENGGGALCKYGNTRLTSFVHIDLVQTALDQGFIEPYEEKPKRWRNLSKQYWTIDRCVVAFERWDDGEADAGHDEHAYEVGNYFKSKETAEAVAEALKLFFIWLHTPVPNNSGYADELYSKMNDRMNEARHRVLADNEVEDE